MLWNSEFAMAPQSEALDHAELFIVVEWVNAEEALVDDIPVTMITRPVAVDLPTHCHIGSKRACYPLASDVEP